MRWFRLGSCWFRGWHVDNLAFGRCQQLWACQGCIVNGSQGRDVVIHTIFLLGSRLMWRPHASLPPYHASTRNQCGTNTEPKLECCYLQNVPHGLESHVGGHVQCYQVPAAEPPGIKPGNVAIYTIFLVGWKPMFEATRSHITRQLQNHPEPVRNQGLIC